MNKFTLDSENRFYKLIDEACEDEILDDLFDIAEFLNKSLQESSSSDLNLIHAARYLFEKFEKLGFQNFDQKATDVVSDLFLAIMDYELAYGSGNFLTSAFKILPVLITSLSNYKDSNFLFKILIIGTDIMRFQIETGTVDDESLSLISALLNPFVSAVAMQKNEESKAFAEEIVEYLAFSSELAYIHNNMEEYQNCFKKMDRIIDLYENEIAPDKYLMFAMTLLYMQMKISIENDDNETVIEAISQLQKYAVKYSENVDYDFEVNAFLLDISDLLFAANIIEDDYIEFAETISYGLVTDSSPWQIGLAKSLADHFKNNLKKYRG